MMEIIHQDDQLPSLIPRGPILRVENRARMIRPPSNPDPLAIPVIKNAAVSRILQNLPLSSSNPEIFANLDKQTYLEAMSEQTQTLEQ